jgi:hypothetical protein
MSAAMLLDWLEDCAAAAEDEAAEALLAALDEAAALCVDAAL